MDSDDISTPDRFKKQITYMKQHPDCDVFGGQISEFIDEESNIVGKRIVPYESSEVMEYLKSRCPLNHVSVMMLKESVLTAGNLWTGILTKITTCGYVWQRPVIHFANVPYVLVNVRVGRDMYVRRGDWTYFKNEEKLQRHILDKHIIDGDSI